MKKKLYIAGAALGGIIFLGLLFALFDSPNTPKDNSKYVVNDRSGTIDFVDPDQSAEGQNNSGALRNLGTLTKLLSANIIGETSNRIKEYSALNTPDEKAYYVLDATITVKNNSVSFKIESESKKTTLDIDVFATRQDTASVYINGEGPFSEFNRYYKLPTEED